MTVLFITRKFPPSTGGMENYAHSLSEALENKIDIKLIKWGHSNKYLPIVLPYFFIKGCYVLTTNKIDIIHAQDGVLAPLGYFLSRIFKKPFAVVLHGLDITHNTQFYQTTIPRFINKADIIFCISQAAADEAIKRKVDAEKIKIIPIGISDVYHSSKSVSRHKLIEDLQLKEESQLLLTVGRLVKRKGVGWFIENVLTNLIQKYPDIVYLIAGDGDERPYIEEIVKLNELKNNVKILGRVSDEFKKDLYNGSDIFIMPNIPIEGDMEGFGLVLLEAALCELPIVASEIEGIKDAVIDNKNGKLVKPKDINASLEEISKFINNKEYAKTFGKKSREYTLENYQWDLIADKYVNYYKDLKYTRK